MAGYKGFSMSHNAVAAYGSGEKPLSKWTKADILKAITNAIKEEELTLSCSMEKLKKAPVKVLKELCLSYSSWHHTSNHYNRTAFYSLNIDKVASLTNEKIDKAEAYDKLEKEVKPLEKRWKCAFLEWGGTRKHPTATEVIVEGIVKGDWFYRADGSKKKTTANGFRFIEEIQ